MNIVTPSGFIIIDVSWFTPMQGSIVGIVRGVNDSGKEKYYIGTGDGFSESADALRIARYGARFYPGMEYANERAIEELKKLLLLTGELDDESEDTHKIVYAGDIYEAIAKLKEV